MAKAYGSTANPVVLDPFHRITEVGWGGFGILDVLFPMDVSYTLSPAPTPSVAASYAVGDTISKIGVDTAIPLIEIFFDASNPVTAPDTWVTVFRAGVPLLQVCPRVVVAGDWDGYQDADQAKFDDALAFWNNYLFNAYTTAYDEHAKALAQYYTDHSADTLRTLNSSDLRDIIATPSGGWKDYTFSYLTEFNWSALPFPGIPYWGTFGGSGYGGRARQRRSEDGRSRRRVPISWVSATSRNHRRRRRAPRITSNG